MSTESTDYLESTSLKKDIVECLKQQLSEIDLLQSMYPNSGDIVVSAKNVADISNFIETDSEYVPNNLDFVMNLIINKIKLEVFIDLPLSYPNEEPDIYIRCNQLNRQQETRLNSGLLECIKNNHVGEVCLYTAITWLQDNIDIFITKEDTEPVNSANEPQIEDKFSRLWIYSHHIYNKKKREDIQKLAKEFNLTGFCFPGKPGIICIEGNYDDCQQWWKIIKTMCWKKIMIKKTEIFELSEESEQREFHSFKELYFTSTTNTKHANMSAFSKFMSEHCFTKIFNDFLGISNE